MRGRNLSFRDRLLVLGVSLTAGSLLLLGAVIWWNNHHLREVSYVGCLRAAEAECDPIAESIDGFAMTAAWPWNTRFGKISIPRQS